MTDNNHFIVGYNTLDDKYWGKKFICRIWLEKRKKKKKKN